MTNICKFKLEEPFSYEEVSPFEFYTYLEDIRKILKDKMPEWHINKIRSPGQPYSLYYHLCQWDFTKKEKKPCPLIADTHVFAIEKNDEYRLLNQQPLRLKNNQTPVIKRKTILSKKK